MLQRKYYLDGIRLRVICLFMLEYYFLGVTVAI
jgi:hypothetical protein